MLTNLDTGQIAHTGEQLKQQQATDDKVFKKLSRNYLGQPLPDAMAANRASIATSWNMGQTKEATQRHQTSRWFHDGQSIR